jgi:hypothetical protein
MNERTARRGFEFFENIGLLVCVERQRGPDRPNLWKLSLPPEEKPDNHVSTLGCGEPTPKPDSYVSTLSNGKGGHLDTKDRTSQPKKVDTLDVHQSLYPDILCAQNGESSSAGTLASDAARRSRAGTKRLTTTEVVIIAHLGENGQARLAAYKDSHPDDYQRLIAMTQRDEDEAWRSPQFQALQAAPVHH